MAPRFSSRSRVLLLTAAAALLFTTAGAFAKEIRDWLTPKRFAEVEPGFLYRSGQLSARWLRKVLRERKISTVISLSHYDPTKAEQHREHIIAREFDVPIIHLHLHANGTGDVRHYVAALVQIARARQEGRAILVHCPSGDRRTGGIIAAYLALMEHSPPERAYAELTRFQKNGKTDPELTLFLNQNMKELASHLVELGLLKAQPNSLPRFPL